MTLLASGAVRIETFGVDIKEFCDMLKDRDVVPQEVVDSPMDPVGAWDFIRTPAVILVVPPRHWGITKQRLEMLARPALVAGSTVIVLVPDKHNQDIVEQWRDKEFFSLKEVESEKLRPQWPRIVVDTDRKSVANLVARQIPAVRPAMDHVLARASLAHPTALWADSKVNELAVLIGRAFGDLTPLSVSRLDQQGATSDVYRVDGSSRGGRKVEPFLAKFSTREDVATESEKFEFQVDDFLPFYVRPSLVRSRTVYGSHTGLLVYRFLEGERALNDVVAGEGALPSTLHNIFDHLLASWWHDGPSGPTVADSRACDGMREWFDPKKAAHIARLNSIAAEIGMRKLSMLISDFDRIAKADYRTGWIHGDMHGGNIRVRGADAFLIDFEKIKTGPLIADAAALEADLVLRTGETCFKKGCFEDWQRFASERLYGKDWDTTVPTFAAVTSSREPLRRLGAALRVVRMHTRATDAGAHNYAQLVAAAFVRKASLPADESRPAAAKCLRVAYSLACQIVDAIIGGTDA